MIDVDVTLLVQLVNLVITLIVLNFLLVRPIRDKIKERAASMSSTLAEVERFTSSAEDKVKKYEAALGEARAAGTEARMTMRDQALSEEKSVVDAASSDAQVFLKSARADVASQAQAAIGDLKARVGAMAQKAADKILG